MEYNTNYKKKIGKVNFDDGSLLKMVKETI